MLGISHGRHLRKKMDAFQDVLDADNDWEAGGSRGLRRQSHDCLSTVKVSWSWIEVMIQRASAALPSKTKSRILQVVN